MSTQATIIIRDEYDEVKVFRHWDGYPEGKNGVMAGLREALKYAWPLPRMEASDFGAAIVRAMKDGEGNIRLIGKVECDTDYKYIVTSDKEQKAWRVDVFMGRHKEMTVHIKE